MQPRVVAIGKWKPVELLQEAYEAGHRHFGENYVQVWLASFDVCSIRLLAEKADLCRFSQEISAKAPQMPEDTQWHFVGHLQSNKVKNLIGMLFSVASSLKNIILCILCLYRAAAEHNNSLCRGCTKLDGTGDCGQ